MLVVAGAAAPAHAQPLFEFVDLGTLGGNPRAVDPGCVFGRAQIYAPYWDASFAMGINNDGVIVGGTVPTDGRACEVVPVVWIDGQLHPLARLEDDAFRLDLVMDVNEAGRAIGEDHFVNDPDDLGAGFGSRALVWDLSDLADRPTLLPHVAPEDFPRQNPRRINELGMHTGHAGNVQNPLGYSGQVSYLQNIVTGEVRVLEEFTPMGNTMGMDVSERNEVVGRTPINGSSVFGAYVWDELGGMRLLEPMSIDRFGVPGDCGALGLNEQGMIVGWAYNGVTIVPSLWQSEHDAPVELAAGSSGSATAINERGEVVGDFFGANIRYAFYWADGQFIDLTSQLPDDSPFVRIAIVNDINDDGAMVGEGVTRDGFLHAVLIRPIGCPADVDGDSDVDSEDFFLYLDALGAGVMDVCDMDADGDCDAEDFFAYLDSFAAGC